MAEAHETATIAAEQSTTALANLQQTATITAAETATALADLQQTATITAAQTATALADLRQTATITAQQTISAAIQGTATFTAEQTITTQQTITAATVQALQSQTAIALVTNTAITIATKQAILSASATALANSNDTATAGAQQTSTTAAQQTVLAAGQQTATAAAQLTLTAAAQQAATTAAQQQSSATTTIVDSQSASHALVAVGNSATAAVPPSPTATLVPTGQTPGGGRPGASPSTISGRDSSQKNTAKITRRVDSARTGKKGSHGGDLKGVATTSRIDPALGVAVSDPVIRPGASDRIAVSYVAHALVEAEVVFTNQKPLTIYQVANPQGRITIAFRVPSSIALHNGRATGTIVVRAVEGPWRRLISLSPSIRPGAPEYVALSYVPNTLVRASVIIPGRPTLTLIDRTDSLGRVSFEVPVPRSLFQHQGHSVAQVVLWALSSLRYAEASRTVAVSDMVLSASGSRIVNCVQTQTVRVSYQPNVPLQVVLTFPHGYRLSLNKLTDVNGNATLNVQVRYVRARSPVAIGINVADGRSGKHRNETATASVSLPAECRR